MATPTFATVTRALTLSVMVAGAAAQGFDPPPNLPTHPAYPAGAGPVVAFDAAHKNTHSFTTPNWRGFVELLRRDGYRPRAMTTRLSAGSLREIDVLVLAQPGGMEGPQASLDGDEIAALVDWIAAGGALLFVLDHPPAPAHGAAVARALGVENWPNGYASVQDFSVSKLRNGNVGRPFIFWQATLFPRDAPRLGRLETSSDATGYQVPDAVLATHPITRGRNDRERVARVATFGGSAFIPPAGAITLLTLPKNTTSAGSPVGGWAQGAVFERGKGRVGLFGETGMFSGGPAADNPQFILNLLHWLTRLL